MLTPRDVIKVTKNREEKDRFKFRTLHFPTLHLCNKCNGYESLDHEGQRVVDPLLSYRVALIKYGWDADTGEGLNRIRKFNPPEEGPCRCHGPIPDQGISLHDAVKWDDRWNTMRWPTLCCCAHCGNYTNTYGARTNSFVLTAYIAHMQDGSRAHHFDNGISNSWVCRCADENENRTKLFEQIPVESDSGWTTAPSSRPSRGIHDFNRVIKFARELTADEMNIVKEYLHYVKCPGWTGIHVASIGTNEFQFRTTWDSSD